MEEDGETADLSGILIVLILIILIAMVFREEIQNFVYWIFQAIF